MDTIKRTEVIDITLTPGKKTYGLGDQEVLRKRPVKGIIVTPSGYKSKTGQSTQDPADAYFTLKDGNNRELLEIPARLLQANVGAPLLHVMPMELDAVNWEKSELRFEDGITIASNTVFQFTVIYE